MIEVQFERELPNTADAPDTPRRKVNRLNFRLNKLYVAQNATDRIDNIARIKISRGDFVQHRRK